jgi:argininosuccinate lyase
MAANDGESSGPAAKGEGKAWGGRFRKPTAPELEAFSASIHFDRELFEQDVRASQAHARMLARQGLLQPDEARALESGLDRVARELRDGSFPIDPSAEDIHMNIERRLFALVGPVAGKLHTGRSRNDQVATDFLLWMRDACVGLRGELLELRAVLVERAGREIDVILPGYTHLQRAQPVRLAHHWLAHFEALSRDDARLRDARGRMDHCPLGAGALAGTSLPLDRASTARELGFAAPARNSMDAVSARDAALELLGALAILAVHLSRIAEELVLWSSSEFDFVRLDDAYSTGSSLMPQKKNPDSAELVRGKSGRVIGALVALLVAMKGLPLSYNRDMQEDKEPVFDAVRTARGSLRVLAGALRTLEVQREKMARATADPLLLATDLAEHLVQRGVAFREAHELVGRVVAHAAESGVELSALDAATLARFHPELAVDPARFFSAERSLETRDLPGGPARKRVEHEVGQAHAAVAATRQELASLGIAAARPERA